MVDYRLLRILFFCIGFGGILYVIFQKGLSQLVQTMAVLFCVMLIIFGTLARQIAEGSESQVQPSYYYPRSGGHSLPWMST